MDVLVLSFKHCILYELNAGGRTVGSSSNAKRRLVELLLDGDDRCREKLVATCDSESCGIIESNQCREYIKVHK